MEELNEVRFKNEPICYNQSISQTKKVKKVKGEPLEIEMQTSKSHIDAKLEKIEVKEEKKLEDFTKAVSIAFFK